ncbi:phosphoribosyltransferase, partial [Candidatus Uhrbacteria bacterium]|nr:phosphoribosyltransferase [Candidatus Uhrbacteria bacterium]
MTEQEIKSILVKTNAVITNDHFVYTSGKHGSTYINKDAVFAYAREMEKLGMAIAEKFSNAHIDVILGPVVGGAILAQWTASALSNKGGQEVLAVYADKGEKDGDGTDTFMIKRGYDTLIKDKRVLIVEDILTTGGSVRKVVAVAREEGADIIGVCALCNRGGVTPHDIGDVPRLEALISVVFEIFDASDCPLCKEERPVNTQFGKGKLFV